MKKGNKHEHSLLTVLLMETIAVTLCVCVLVSWVARESSASFEAYIIKSHVQETSAFADVFSSDITKLNIQLYDELCDTALSRLWLYLDSELIKYNYLQQVHIVQRQIETIEKSTYFLDAVKIYMPEHERVISKESVIWYEPASWPIPKELYNTRGIRLISRGDILEICAVRRAVPRQTVMIAATVTQKTLAQYLKKYISDEDVLLAVMYENGDESDFFTVSATIDDELAQSVQAAMAQEAQGRTQVIVDGIRYLLIWEHIEPIPLRICRLMPMAQIDAQLDAYNRMVGVICVLVAVLLVLLNCFLYEMVKRPVRHMSEALRGVGEGDLSVRIQPTWSSEFGQIFSQFNQMTERLGQLIDQEYTLKMLTVKAELKQMRYQISPHFLYNTYFNMRAMLHDEDYEAAEEMCGLMGRYLRYITTSVEDEATLEEELGHALAYLQIQKLRFGERLSVRVEPCPRAARGIHVPRIIIQPLIENSFEHGVKDRRDLGIIGVQIQLEGERLSVFVDDNGPNASDEMIASLTERLRQDDFDPSVDSVALMNIQKRIRLSYMQGSGVFVSHSPLGGLRVEIRMLGVKGDAAYADCGR